MDEALVMPILNNALKEVRKKGGEFNFEEVDLANNFEKVLSSLNEILDQLDDFLLNKGICSRIKNYLYNDCFGSFNQYRDDINNRFNVEEINIKTNDRNSLNW